MEETVLSTFEETKKTKDTVVLPFRSFKDHNTRGVNGPEASSSKVSGNSPGGWRGVLFITEL